MNKSPEKIRTDMYMDDDVAKWKRVDALIDSTVPTFMSDMCRDKLRDFVQSQFVLYNSSNLFSRMWKARLPTPVIVLIIFFVFGFCVWSFSTISPNASKMFALCFSSSIAIIVTWYTMVLLFRKSVLSNRKNDNYWISFFNFLFKIDWIWKQQQEETFVASMEDLYSEFLSKANDSVAMDCQYLPATGFGPCSSECGGGIQTRSPVIVRPANAKGKQCPRPETRVCNADVECPVDCEVTWKEWSSCEPNCGPGTQTRTGIIKVKPNKTGKPCPEQLTETRECANPPCKVNCLYTWDEWSECSEPCGGGTQTRDPDIIAVPEGGGKDCPKRESRGCNTQPCPEDCVFRWEDWSDCDEVLGTQSRSAKILRAPTGSGEACPTRPETRQCDVPCKYTWDEWSPCEGDCGIGVQTRVPVVIRQPLGEGTRCPVPQTKSCTLDKVCCDYSQSPYESERCPSVCGGGSTTIKKTAISNGPVDCPEIIQKTTCNQHACPPLPPITQDLTAYYSGESFDSTNVYNLVWRNSVNDKPENDALISSVIRTSIPSFSRMMLKGTFETVIQFPTRLLSSTYTMFYVARYSPQTTNKGRILCASDANWSSGFSKGYAGVAIHGDYITPETGIEAKDDFIVCTDQAKLFRHNGWTTSYDDMTGLDILVPESLGINVHPEKSDFDIGCILVYSSVLSDDDIRLIETWIASQYNCQICHCSVTRPLSSSRYEQVMLPGSTIRNGRFSATFVESTRSIKVEIDGTPVWAYNNPRKMGRMMANSAGYMMIITTNGILLWQSDQAFPKSNVLSLTLRENGVLFWNDAPISSTCIVFPKHFDQDAIFFDSESTSSLVSSNQRFTLDLTSDGRLVLSDISQSKPVPMWRTRNDVDPKGVQSMRYQVIGSMDGNLSIYNVSTKKTIWSEQTVSFPFGIILKDDGSVSTFNSTSSKTFVKITTTIPPDNFGGTFSAAALSLPPVMNGIVMYMTADTWDSKNNVWKSHVGSVTAQLVPPVVSTTLSVPRIVSSPYFNRNVLVGDAGCVMSFDAKLPRDYTLFFVARQRSTRGKIFCSKNGGWFSGFDVERSGVARHGDWITGESDVHGYGWVLGSDQRNMFRSNMQDRTIGTIAGTTINPDTLMLNDSGTDRGDWAVASVIAYNRTLTSQEVKLVEIFLKNAFDYELIPSSLPSAQQTYKMPEIGATPWAYFVAESFDSAGRRWKDVSGNGRDAIVTSKTLPALANMTSASRKYLYSGRDCAVKLMDQLTATTLRGDRHLTIFYLAKYNGPVKNRILTDGSGGWYCGFADGKSGVAMHGTACQTPQSDVHGNDWVISSDHIWMYRSNGAVRMMISDPSLTPIANGPVNGLYVNHSLLYGSDFAIACILIYDKKLALSDMVTVENFIKDSYNINFGQDLASWTDNVAATKTVYDPPIKDGLTAYYSVYSFETGTRILHNMVTPGRQNDPFDVQIGKTLEVSAQGTELVGDESSEIVFPRMNMKEYTLFHVAKYDDTSPDSKKNVVFGNIKGGGPDWRSGFSQGNYGMAVHGGWSTYEETPYFLKRRNEYLLSTDQPRLYRANGRDIKTSKSNPPVIPEQITLNGFETSHRSNFAFRCLLIYTRELSIQEIRIMENWIASSYQVKRVSRQVTIMDVASPIVSNNGRFKLSIDQSKGELVLAADKNSTIVWTSSSFEASSISPSEMIANIDLDVANTVTLYLIREASISPKNLVIPNVNMIEEKAGKPVLRIDVSDYGVVSIVDANDNVLIPLQPVAMPPITFGSDYSASLIAYFAPETLDIGNKIWKNVVNTRSDLDANISGSGFEIIDNTAMKYSTCIRNDTQTLPFVNSIGTSDLMSCRNVALRSGYDKFAVTDNGICSAARSKFWGPGTMNDGRNTFKCSDNLQDTVYDYNGVLRNLQNPSIAATWDPDWKNAPVINCLDVPRGPALDAYVPFNYMGCFVDGKNNTRTMSDKLSAKVTSVQQCIDLGASKSYAFVGLQNFSECWGSKTGSYDTQGISDASNCKNDALKKSISDVGFGNANTNAVYTTAKLEQGKSYSCLNAGPNIYRYEGSNLRLYPSDQVGKSWDPDWKNAAKMINCTNIPLGPQMEMKNFVGCYRDLENNVRTMPDLLASGVTDVQDCVTLGAQKGYPFVGLQNNSECWGSKTFGSYASQGTKDLSECRKQCSGNGSNSIIVQCGGSGTNAVYNTGITIPANFVNCVQNAQLSKPMPLPDYLGKSTSVSSCIALGASKGYPYVGLQNFGECWGGKVTKYDVTDLSKCQNSAQGRTSNVQFGQKDVSAVYSTELAPVLPSNFVGCFKDDAKDRALPDLISSSVRSVEECVALGKEKNYPYVGIQRNSECWGSDVKYDKHGAANIEECQRQCSGTPGVGSFLSDVESGGQMVNAVYRTDDFASSKKKTISVSNSNCMFVCGKNTSNSVDIQCGKPKHGAVYLSVPSPAQGGNAYVRGSSNSSVTFPNTLKSDWYTVVHVARYGANANRNDRIFTSASNAKDWVSGFANDSTGVAKHGSTWLTNQVGTVDTGEWIVSTHTRGYTYKYVKSSLTAVKKTFAYGRFRVNGKDVAFNSTDLDKNNEPTFFTINGKNPSPWEVACVLVFDNELQDADIEQIEKWLMQRYKTSVSYQTVLTATGALPSNANKRTSDVTYLNPFTVRSVNDKYRMKIGSKGDLEFMQCSAGTPCTSHVTTWTAGAAGASELFLRWSDRDVSLILAATTTSPHIARWVNYPLDKNSIPNSTTIFPFEITGSNAPVVKIGPFNVNVTTRPTVLALATPMDNVFFAQYLVLRRTDNNGSGRVAVNKIRIYDEYGKLMDNSGFTIECSPNPNNGVPIQNALNYKDDNPDSVTATQQSADSWMKVTLDKTRNIKIGGVVVTPAKGFEYDMDGISVQFYRNDGMIIYNNPISTKQVQLPEYDFFPEDKVKAAFVVVRRIDNQPTSINLAEIQVYDSIGVRIASGLSATLFPFFNSKYDADNLINGTVDIAMTAPHAEAEMRIDVTSVGDISGVIVVNREDCCMESMIGTRISLEDADGTILASVNVTSAKREYQLIVRKYVPLKYYTVQDFYQPSDNDRYQLDGQPILGTVTQCSKICDADIGCVGFTRNKRASRNDSNAACYLKNKFKTPAVSDPDWESWVRY